MHKSVVMELWSPEVILDAARRRYCCEVEVRRLWDNLHPVWQGEQWLLSLRVPGERERASKRERETTKEEDEERSSCPASSF